MLDRFTTPNNINPTENQQPRISLTLDTWTDSGPSFGENGWFFNPPSLCPHGHRLLIVVVKTLYCLFVYSFLRLYSFYNLASLPLSWGVRQLEERCFASTNLSPPFLYSTFPNLSTHRLLTRLSPTTHHLSFLLYPVSPSPLKKQKWPKEKL